MKPIHHVKRIIGTTKLGKVKRKFRTSEWRYLPKGSGSNTKFTFTHKGRKYLAVCYSPMLAWLTGPKNTDWRRRSCDEQARIYRVLGQHNITPKLLYNDENVLVMEYLDMPSLSVVIEKLSKTEYRMIMKAFAKNVKTMTELGIFHYDLHPDNMLVDTKRGKLYLIDFESDYRGVKRREKFQERLLKKFSRGIAKRKNSEQLLSVFMDECKGLLSK